MECVCKAKSTPVTYTRSISFKMPFIFPLQKQDLTVAEAKAVINGADAVDGEVGAGNGTDAIQLQIQQLSLELEQAKKVTLQKEEEVKLYKTKFDETTSQMTQLVSSRHIIPI